MTRLVFDTPLWQAAMASLPQEKQNVFDLDVLKRIIGVQQGIIADVSPETCMKSPTVHAIITAITRRFAVTPLHVYRKTRKDGRDNKELLADHPVAKLLAYPNSFQSRVDYWMDATSWFARYGCFYAFKSRGKTGPIRSLLPMNPRNVTVKQDPNTWNVIYEWGGGTEGQQTYTPSQVHTARGPARNGFSGDSPVNDVAQSIALEIAAESMGATLFSNGAIPLMVFKYMTGTQRFKDEESEKQFIEDFQAQFSGTKRHKALLLPKGIEQGTPLEIDNDKAQFIETRRYQRTVIAGAWGVPPHLVGDLERATFNNVEQQDQDFTGNVIMPIAQAFEAAIERDLLTTDDVNSGVIVRFNLDSVLRADFKSRQEGSQIQRQNGAISANEWREREGMNPISEEDGGDEYIRPANMAVAGEPTPLVPAGKPKPNGSALPNGPGSKA